jgi:hypothetical protein
MVTLANAANWTDYVQAGSWVAATITAMIGVFKFGQEHRKAREQRAEEIQARQEANRAAERELEWRRASSAQASLEKMESDRRAADAMLMLDWDGRDFSDGNETWTLRKEEVIAALRVQGDGFNNAEIYVRDAFDHLFWHFERIQHQINVGLITLDHVRFPLAYLVALMDQTPDEFARYLRDYGYEGATALVESLRSLGLPNIAAHHERFVY